MVCRSCDPKRARQDVNLQRHLKYQERARKGQKKGWIGATLLSLLVVGLIATGAIAAFFLLVPIVAFVAMGYVITKNH